jgi:hypothetical protein
VSFACANRFCATTFVEMMAPAIIGTLFNNERRQTPFLVELMDPSCEHSLIPRNNESRSRKPFASAESSGHPFLATTALLSSQSGKTCFQKGGPEQAGKRVEEKGKPERLGTKPEAEAQPKSTGRKRCGGRRAKDGRRVGPCRSETARAVHDSPRRREESSIGKSNLFLRPLGRRPDICHVGCLNIH